MCKKLLLVAVIGVAAFAALRGTKFFGLAKQEIADAQSWLDNQIPVEKEIARLEKEVGGLDKDRSKVADLLAKEIVEVRYLRESTDELRVAVGGEDERLRQAADDIKKATQQVKYGRSMVSIPEAKEMLRGDVARQVARKNSLDVQEKTLTARERNREYLEKQLDTLQRQKNELATQIEAFKSEYKALQLAQMESKYQTDSTRLAGIKDSLRELKKKLEIEREKLKLAPRVAEETTAVSTSQSVDDIIAPLDNGKKADTKKVSQTD
jgi:seryl-tRNA synthetase